MRSSSKNMCSVRQSPMPSARIHATRASFGVSALARTAELAGVVGQLIQGGESRTSPAPAIATLPVSTCRSRAAM